jgi:hypothetical protein
MEYIIGYGVAIVVFYGVVAFVGVGRNGGAR